MEDLFTSSFNESLLQILLRNSERYCFCVIKSKIFLPKFNKELKYAKNIYFTFQFSGRVWRSIRRTPWWGREAPPRSRARPTASKVRRRTWRIQNMKLKEMQRVLETKEYWMICRGPGFLAVGWFGSSLIPSPALPSVCSTRESATQRKTEKERQVAEGRWGEEDGWGAESYDRKKA